MKNAVIACVAGIAMAGTLVASPVVASVSSLAITPAIAAEAPVGKAHLEFRMEVDRSLLKDKRLDADRTFDITIQAKDANGNAITGVYGDTTFRDGKATVSLASNRSAIARDMPAGTTWTSTVSVPEGYRLLSSQNASGRIEAGYDVTASYTLLQLTGYTQLHKVCA